MRWFEQIIFQLVSDTHVLLHPCYAEIQDLTAEGAEADGPWSDKSWRVSKGKRAISISVLTLLKEFEASGSQTAYGKKITTEEQTSEGFSLESPKTWWLSKFLYRL